MRALVRVVKELLYTWERDRRVLVSAGVVLILVPTLFSVFPAWTTWPRWLLVLIIFLWLGVAVFLVAGTTRQSEHIERLIGTPLERRTDQRLLAGARLMRGLLTHETGLPSHYEFRVFTYDEGRNRLIPSYEPEGVERSEGWEVGKGATGLAWDTKEYVVVRGDKVSDGTYGLTPEQQERYKSLEVVAAMPVRNAREQVVAILTGSSETDDGQLVSKEGFRRHRELSEIVARLLIDVLHEARD